MKWLSCIALALIFFASEVPCSPSIRRGLKLKSDEPIEGSRYDTDIQITDSTGSIGTTTFSLLMEMDYLRIVKSRISHIENGAICSPPKLKKLIIAENEEFPLLTHSHFHNCEKLEFVKLKGVEFTPDALKSMTNVDWLQFYELKDFHLTKEHLEPLKNLRDLEFRDSNIEKIDDNVICLSPKLQSLYTENNTIVSPLTKATFENCNQVEDRIFILKSVLKLEKEAFSGFTSLKSAWLQNLNIAHLTRDHLVGLNGTEILYIEDSNVSTIDADTFIGFNNVYLLDLSGNKLNEINTDFLTPLLSLETLDLDSNEFASIDNIRHPKLRGLNVNSNKISSVDAKSVKENLPKLKYVYITNNPVGREEEVNLMNKTLNETSIYYYSPK